MFVPVLTLKNGNKVMKKESQNRIVMPIGNGKKLAKAMGVTPEYLSGVLNGKWTKGELARKIRYTAIKEFDGVEIKK